MAGTNIKVVEKTPGKHLEYSVTAEKISFNDEELTIKLSTKERDDQVILDICMDKDQGLIVGTGGNAHSYAAQVVIPPRRYVEQQDGEDEEGNPKFIPVPQPFDMKLCTLYLWGLED